MAGKGLGRGDTRPLEQTRVIRQIKEQIDALPAISAFVKTLLDDADAAAFFTTLGVSAFVQTILDDTDAAAVRGTISAQESDATLTALSAFNTNGLLAQTASDTFAGRAITGTAGQIAVSDGDGVAGNPTISAVIASQGEAEAGTDATKLMTAERVSQAIAALATVPDATDSVKGKVELATSAETITGTDTARATTPAGVSAAVENYAQPIPTNETFPVGAIAFGFYNSTTAAANGATFAGTLFYTASSVPSGDTLNASPGGQQTGTWRNISGTTFDSNGAAGTTRWGYARRTV